MRANASEETVFVSCAPGLEEVLEAEARALGFPAEKLAGGVLLRGRPGLHRTANLQLRTASRVLLRVATFEAADLRAFEAALGRVDVAPYRVSELPVSIGTAIHGARWRGGGSVEDAFARAWKLYSAPRPPSEDRADAEQAFYVRVDKDRCELSVDTSGAPLYRRGYRQEVSRAPIRETLAAGILALADPADSDGVVDPMCGSGTFLIERAWSTLRRAPGIQRTFAFERWPSHDANAWHTALALTRRNELPAPSAPVYGSDNNAGSLGTARRNARRANVSLTLERLDATKASPPGGLRSGLVVANLPYGKRVGERDELSSLYRSFGENLRRQWRGFRTALLIPDDEKLANLLPSERTMPLMNGGLRCRLLLGTLR